MRGILAHSYVKASDDPAAHAADCCGRQAVTVEWACEFLMGETLYVYNGKSMTDPWLTIDAGIDRETHTGRYILCYDRTGEMKVDGDFRVFASKKAVLAVK